VSTSLYCFAGLLCWLTDVAREAGVGMGVG